VRITVLGGRGLLGRQLTPLLKEAGHEVTVASRTVAGPGHVTTDLATGEGLTDALRGAQVLVHLASDPHDPRATDIDGTDRLLALIGDHQHLIYVSIVGVDRHPYRYYRVKRRVEQMIESSGASYSILRSTQFFDFIARLLNRALARPVALIPKRWVAQPVETREVAAALVELVETRPPGLQPDFCGPEILTAEHLARTFMETTDQTKPLVNLPTPGPAGRAFRAGLHTNPERAVGTKTWAEFLEGLRRHQRPRY
jgi:uncharacterized protein YbjT (DUF2867 family)